MFAALFIMAEVYNSKGRIIQMSIKLGMDKMWFIQWSIIQTTRNEVLTYYNVDES